MLIWMVAALEPAMGPVPIAVDWGIPVIKQDLDDKRVFSFYIGINR